MKKIINWQLFGVLLASSIITTLFVLPYQLALSPALAQAFTPLLLVGAVIQGTVMFSIFIFVGLLLARRYNLGLPIIEGLLKGENQAKQLKSILWPSIVAGSLGGVLIILLSFLWPSLAVTFLKAETLVAPWKGFLASFYGGIGEEIFARLFLITLFIWLIVKIKRSPKGIASNTTVWTAIILSSILFGLGHLPITGGITAITVSVVLRAILLNGIVSVVFGWLYWKNGLESAMIAHFSADIVLHVITPFVVLMFL